MDPVALDTFEAFLEESDSDIWQWVAGQTAPAHARYDALLEQLKAQRLA
jgi:succinate dehydrogenase flavin-adding protein (antitoxin of CptAB toxin-antitoxin module)